MLWIRIRSDPKLFKQDPDPEKVIADPSSSGYEMNWKYNHSEQLVKFDNFSAKICSIEKNKFLFVKKNIPLKKLISRHNEHRYTLPRQDLMRNTKANLCQEH
jgi:hypothetical protein